MVRKEYMEMVKGKQQYHLEILFRESIRPIRKDLGIITDRCDEGKIVDIDRNERPFNRKVRIPVLNRRLNLLVKINRIISLCNVIN